MYKQIKRLFDIFSSAVLIIVLLPVWIIIPFLIFSIMGLPIIFKQKRVGLNNRVFEINKFRSMKNKSNSDATDIKRITGFGRILRITRIDEFPQLFNIFLGEMSFIGPRPLLPEYLPCYTPEELRRHEVRPGLSGLSQVSGSYLIWEDQFMLDVQYVDNVSLKTDIKILMQTIFKVFKPSKKLISGNSGRERFDLYRMGRTESTA